MSGPEQNTLFETSAAVSSALRKIPRTAAKTSAPRALSAAALSVAGQQFKEAYSPIVVAGAVRMIEVALVATVGVALYFWLAAGVAYSARYYIGSIAGISLFSAICSFCRETIFAARSRSAQ